MVNRKFTCRYTWNPKQGASVKVLCHREAPSSVFRLVGSGAGAASQDHRDGSLLACTAVEGDAPVSLGRFHNLGLLLRPLRRLLFFRRHSRFLLLFPLIFKFFGHRIGSIFLRGSVAYTAVYIVI